MSSRLLGLALVAVVAWNAAFAAAPRYGIFLTVGAAALLATLRSLAVPTPWRQLFSPRVNALVLAATAAALLVCATAFFREPILGAFPALDAQVRALYAMFGTPTLLQAYVALPLIAIAEELVFRGAIQGGLEKRLGRFGAAFAAAAIYACGHLMSHSPVLIVLALLLGSFWGLLRARSQSLLPGVVSHVLWDLFVVVWSPWVSARVYHL